MGQVLRITACINERVSAFIWGPYMLALFLLAGLYFSLRTGFFQVFRLKLWLSKTILACFRDKSVHTSSDKKTISQFQAMTTSLASSIGTGNIAGVATAIVLGGPGAVFWMWVSAFFGMMTGYAENVLGTHFRYKNSKNELVGGPMAYMERGLRYRWMAVLFSFLAILASVGMGNMTQSNSIAAAMQELLNLPPLLTGVIAAAVVSLVIFGGIRRIAGVAEKLVPVMALVYIIGGLGLIFANYRLLPGVFSAIFRSAFGLRAAGAGILGYSLAKAMRYGIARGVFSNEAGLGSSALAHAAADVKEPVIQGMWSIFEIFIDTIVVCTITALAILLTGAESSGLSGTALTMAAFFTQYGKAGSIFITVSVIMFAFATIIGWNYFGEQAVDYLFGRRAVGVYKVLSVALCVVGAASSLNFVWDLSDMFNGLMALPNLIAILLLSETVFSLTKDYLHRHSHHK